MAPQPPPKPWDRRIPSAFQSSDLGPSVLTRPGPPVLARVPPPVPSRSSRQIEGSSLTGYRPAYSSLSSSYSPYGSSLYGGIGGYSPLSYGYAGGLGYNRFRNNEIPSSRFVQHAEESSRGAFQSIESIVHAFSSVSMMMDATFSAVYNSFRAVLDVANHFSRLKVHFTKVFSAFALVRSLRYLYRRLQRLMGLRKDLEAEDLWLDSTGSEVAAGANEKAANSVKSWPIFLFFAVVLGGPYLIWKLLSSVDGSEETGSTNWSNGDDDHVVARVEYDFSAASKEEISVRVGDMLNLAPKEQQPRVRGWLLASLDGQTTGLVPANYVKILGKRRGRKQAELERIAEQQQLFNNTQQTAGAVGPVEILADQEVAFESVFTETRGHSGGLSSPESVVVIPDQLDL
ncbi:peroxisomal membrane protein PEX13-like [Acipenser ruthenus]|nr:peroxisomal membrane protein PEX13-like [Acipenser ruthenus]